MQISVFAEKLNKVTGNIYVIEEEVRLTDGVYEAELRHDNINEATLAVYTGPKLTGERIQSYAVSTPSLMPWKKIIRAYADVPVLYISYETDGDTVEAGDVNKIQEAVTETQAALNEEVDRAGKAEDVLTKDLESEIIRAKGAEKVLTDNLADEVGRATGKEAELAADIRTEADRAKRAETVLTRDLDGEITRAKAAEKANADNLSAESSRARTAEDAIRGTINTNKPVWDDKYTRNEVDNKLSAMEMATDWKEAVDTFADLSVAYPDPDDGWTVNVKDTDYTYRWSGTEWVVISANAIPKATQEVDGLLAKEDKAGYDDAYSKRHTHSNKSVIDKITQVFLDNWSKAFTHISDAVKHITAVERTAWNGAVGHTADKSNPHAVTKTQVGLGYADNTSDANKPISNAVQSALNAKSPKEGSVSLKRLASEVTFGDGASFSIVQDGASYRQRMDCFDNSVPGDAVFRFSQSENSGGAYKTLFEIRDDGNAFTGKGRVYTDGNKPSKADVGLGSVENKSGAAIRGELTKAEVVKALGYTPPTPAPSYTHPNSGVVAGTYRSVTLNAQGHVTAGTNPTTLAGYGISDAVKSTRRTITLTVGGWSGAYPFTQTVTVSGIVASDSIKIIGVSIPANATLAQVKAWNKAAGLLMHNSGGVAANQITFKAYKKPAVDFTIITEGA